MNDLEKQVEDIFKNVMNLDEMEEVRDDMSTDNLITWDSMASLALINELEEGLGIQITFSDMMQIETFADVKAIVNKIYKY